MTPVYQVADLLIFNPRYRRLRLAAALTVYAAVLIFGSVPGARQEIGRLAPGLVLHFLTYAFITGMLFGGWRRITYWSAVASLLIVSAMGSLDEFVQSFFTYRTATVADWGIDTVAGLSTLALLWLIRAGRPSRRPAERLMAKSAASSPK